MDSNISEELLQQIRNCTNLAHRLIHSYHFMNPETVRNTIGRAQGLVLHVLAECDGMTQTEITEKLDIRPSSLGELVAKLEKGGYVERLQNENDKRVINVFLTEKGRQIEKEFVSPRQKAVELWCAGLSEQEKSKLSELLGKLILSMEDALPKTEEKFSEREMPFGAGFSEMDPRHHGSHCHIDSTDGQCIDTMGEWRNGFHF
ncbi:MAG: MarR family transcriptional regulator [Bacillota bacterium]|nr:MarR family transcriptional regulator [Bacillota bacterium]